MKFMDKQKLYRESNQFTESGILQYSQHTLNQSNKDKKMLVGCDAMQFGRYMPVQKGRPDNGAGMFPEMVILI
jgi:hypothetical protein